MSSAKISFWWKIIIFLSLPLSFSFRSFFSGIVVQHNTKCNVYVMFFFQKRNDAQTHQSTIHIDINYIEILIFTLNLVHFIQLNTTKMAFLSTVHFCGFRNHFGIEKMLRNVYIATHFRDIVYIVVIDLVHPSVKSKHKNEHKYKHN